MDRKAYKSDIVFNIIFKSFRSIFFFIPLALVLYLNYYEYIIYTILFALSGSYFLIIPINMFVKYIILGYGKNFYIVFDGKRSKLVEESELGKNKDEIVVYDTESEKKVNKFMNRFSFVWISIGIVVIIVTVLVPAIQDLIAYENDDIYKFFRYAWVFAIIFVILCGILLGVSDRIKYTRHSKVEEFIEEDLINRK